MLRHPATSESRTSLNRLITTTKNKLALAHYIYHNIVIIFILKEIGIHDATIPKST